MNLLKNVNRIIIGLVFMFSGAVKAIDPLGSAYKFGDYFQAFHLDFLQPFALALGIILCTAEFVAGFSVLSGYRIKTGVWGVMLLMIIFTPLTLVLALTNPVSDCGCFGDAIHLTNWQTFGKNVILLIPALFLFINRNKLPGVCEPRREWNAIISVSVFFVIFSLLNLRYLQLFDFLPYKTGNNIPEGMMIPEDAPADEYLSTFIYEKDGVQKEFTLENYPADDTTWVFVDQISVLVKKGYIPPIHDFAITTTQGDDITDWILTNPGYTMIMISTKLNEAAQEHLEKGFELGEWCNEKGMSFYVVTASGSDVVMNYQNSLIFCTADEITLKTIIRSNPGYMLLRDGNIMGKWSWATLPPKENFVNDMTAAELQKMTRKPPVLVVYSLALAALVLFLLVSQFFVVGKNRKKEVQQKDQ
ncbi:MAG TPA: DoxX family protein [Bacteroidales bacterium]|jgi:hypothetical protein|nr:DoxX family protein [Bacteroidales bacterium]HNY53418.1 DoxX family protein [Bacteroidales bacterium]HOG55798.1 DoxX family protein [Bacteroidales bacterium]HQB85512.1 DoxX family protein [Bacteroidales bacterium]